jgi:hypothetical protein
VMMKCISQEDDTQLLCNIYSAYLDHTHHNVLSSTKHSDMDSTSPQVKMTRWSSSSNAEIVSYFRSKPRSMPILFGPSISPGHLESGELTSWVFCSGHQEGSGFSL